MLRIRGTVMGKHKTLVSMATAHRSELAVEIKRRRAVAGLTQQALADAVGVSVLSVKRWESGDRSPTADYLSALDRVLCR